MIRAMSREFKGEEPAKEAEIQFAYLRETLVGSLLRIEAVRLPAAEKGAVKVYGRLLDINGHDLKNIGKNSMIIYVAHWPLLIIIKLLLFYL